MPIGPGTAASQVVGDAGQATGAFGRLQCPSAHVPIGPGTAASQVVGDAGQATGALARPQCPSAHVPIGPGTAASQVVGDAGQATGAFARLQCPSAHVPIGPGTAASQVVGDAGQATGALARLQFPSAHVPTGPSTAASQVVGDAGQATGALARLQFPSAHVPTGPSTAASQVVGDAGQATGALARLQFPSAHVPTGPSTAASQVAGDVGQATGALAELQFPSAHVLTGPSTAASQVAGDVGQATGALAELQFPSALVSSGLRAATCQVAEQVTGAELQFSSALVSTGPFSVASPVVGDAGQGIDASHVAGQVPGAASPFPSVFVLSGSGTAVSQVTGDAGQVTGALAKQQTLSTCQLRHKLCNQLNKWAEVSEEEVRLSALRAIHRPARTMPEWPHPSHVEACTVRYLLSCESTRMVELLGVSSTELWWLREVAVGYRYPIASAWFRAQPVERQRELTEQMDVEATSSSDFGTPPLSTGSSSTASPSLDRRGYLAANEFPARDVSVSLHSPGEEVGAARLEADEEQPSGFGMEPLGSSSEGEMSEESVAEEYRRVHAFNSWDPAYRPRVVQQRVEAWRRLGLRQGLSPEIQDLSYSENSSVQMMVGYFRYERPRSDRSETPSPPAVRTMYLCGSCPIHSWHHLSYLQPCMQEADLSRAAVLSVSSAVNSCEKGEDESQLPGNKDSQPHSLSSSVSFPEENTGSWQVELPAAEVSSAIVEELCHQHYAAAVTAKRLARDLECLSPIDGGHPELLQLWLDQKVLRDQLESVLVQAKTVQVDEAEGVSGDSGNSGFLSAQDVSLSGDVPTDTFLHTRTVGLQEVRSELSLWKQPAQEELEALFDRTQACRKTTEQQVQQWIQDGVTVHVLPGKAVCTRKAGVGKRRFRAVVCGNYLPAEAASGESTYAGGIEAITVRIALSFATRQGWYPSSLDVRTAFLNAPVQKSDKTVLIVKPPKILEDLQLSTSGERWIVDKALYGLTTSPRDWSRHRDSILKSMPIPSCLGVLHLHQCRADDNLWKLVDEGHKTHGLLIVYVDDLLLLTVKERADEVWSAIKKQWQTTEPCWATGQEPLSFCGLELYRSGQCLWIRQTRYIQELLDRHNVTQVASSPMSNWVPPQCPEQPSLEKVREAQKVTGELLWISTKSRPDLSYAVGKLSQYATKSPDDVLMWAQQIWKYLNNTRHLAIQYGGPISPLGSHQQLQKPRSEQVLELYSDASHAPHGDRSQQCTVALWCGDLILWDAGRQPFVALSSAECELISMLATMNIGESIGPFFEELLEDDLQHHLYGDNQAACRSFEDSATNWRTRHLKIRAAAGRERVQLGTWSVMHIPGQYQLADIATKPLAGPRLLWLLQLMNVTFYDHTATVFTQPAPSAIPVGTGKSEPAPSAIPVGTGKSEPAPSAIPVGTGKSEPAPSAIPVGTEKSEPAPSAIPVGTGKSENQTSKVEYKGEEGPCQGEFSPRHSSSSRPKVRLQKPSTTDSALKESSGQPVTLATQIARESAEEAMVPAGAIQRPVQVRMALIAIILASLCYPTEGSRDVVFFEGGNSFTNAVSLQELAGWTAMFLLVVLVWEVWKWIVRRLTSCVKGKQSLPTKASSTSSMAMERFSTNGPDKWELYNEAKLAILVHHKPRQMLYDPGPSRLPFAEERLTGFRITVVYFLSSKQYRFIVDHLSEPGRARFHLHQAWVGQTVLLLK